MSNPLDTNAGKPSLAHLQTLEDNWTQDEIDTSARVAKVTVATGGSTGVEATIPVGAEIFDVTVVCTRTNGSGSMQVKTGADTPVAITDAITCAVDTTVTRAGTIDDANNVNIVGSDGVKVFANADADGGIVYIHYLK